MRNFCRYFSERFKKGEYEIDFKKEDKERQEQIDKMTEEGILKKPNNGKRFAISKLTKSIYEIINEKDSFFRVKDNKGIASWEEKSMFYADNIVYNTEKDFIEEEKNKLLSLIDTSRYDVYEPISIASFSESPSLEMIDKIQKENADSIMDFIRAHTTADFDKTKFVFSNYILIGF